MVEILKRNNIAWNGDIKGKGSIVLSKGMKEVRESSWKCRGGKNTLDRKTSQCKGPVAAASPASLRKRTRLVWLKGTYQGGRANKDCEFLVVVHTHVLSFGSESPGIMTEQQKQGLPASVSIPSHGRSLCLCLMGHHPNHLFLMRLSPNCLFLLKILFKVCTIIFLS